MGVWGEGREGKGSVMRGSMEEGVRGGEEATKTI